MNSWISRFVMIKLASSFLKRNIREKYIPLFFTVFILSVMIGITLSVLLIIVLYIGYMLMLNYGISVITSLFIVVGLCALIITVMLFGIKKRVSSSFGKHAPAECNNIIQEFFDGLMQKP